MINFTCGADPEIFVADATGPRSVIGKVGGTKEQPLPLPLGNGFAVQEDNVAMEFCIPPASSKAEFISYIKQATGFLEKEVCLPYNWSFDKRSAISFPEQELNDPRAFVFGCEPDFNAWTGGVNPRPKTSDKLLRSAGGHVHIGCAHLGVNRVDVVKACDLFLGVPSILMDEGKLRRKLYGKAGAHRPKPYGVEYRTLSNFWIFEEKYTNWVYEGVQRALEAVLSGMDIDSEQENILSAINKNNVKIAEMLVAKYNLDVA